MAYTMNGIGVSRCFQDGGVWILGPEHAATLASKGWSKKDIREFLYKTARAPFWAQPPMVEGKCVTTACCPPESFGPVGPDTMIPLAKSAGSDRTRGGWRPRKAEPVLVVHGVQSISTCDGQG